MRLLENLALPNFLGFRHFSRTFFLCVILSHLLTNIYEHCSTSALKCAISYTIDRKPQIASQCVSIFDYSTVSWALSILHVFMVSATLFAWTLLKTGIVRTWTFGLHLFHSISCSLEVKLYFMRFMNYKLFVAGCTPRHIRLCFCAGASAFGPGSARDGHINIPSFHREFRALFVIVLLYKIINV